MSINWRLDATPAPALLVLPRDAASLDEAHAAIELWEHYTGKSLDSTQVLAVELMMAESSAGRWAAGTTGREMPRQNGKGDEIEVVELWGLVQRGEAILHTIHDAVLLASQAQQRMLAVLDHRDLRGRVKRKWLGTGQQMIELRNGGTIWYRTRTGGGGRGVDDIDRLVVDEAQHATEEHLAAITSTLLANSNPQLNAMGTSGLAGKSDWWWMIRRRALGDDPGSFAYVGHTAERVSLDADGAVVQEPVDVSDRALWLLSNPATVRRPEIMEFLEEEFRRLSPESFAREHMGVWDPPIEAERRDPKLDPERWAATIGDVAAADPVKLAFDVEIDGTSAAIVAASGALGGEVVVDVVEVRGGTGWLPERIVELAKRHAPSAIGCNGAGPAGALVGPVQMALREAKVQLEVTQLNQREYAQACGGLFLDVAEGRLRRPPGQQPLDLAGEDAAERALGESWAWERRQATVPIAPLVAATIARALLPVVADAPKPVFAY